MATKKNIEDIYPLSPIQEGILFHSLLEPDSNVYGNQVVFPLHEAIDPERFKQAWELLFDRHAMLRTVFTWEKSKKPLHVVGKKVLPRWQEEDWCHLGSVLAHEKFRAFIHADRRKTFDLSKAPITRLALLRVSENSFFFVWSGHHILQDGWSSGLVLRELQLIYHGLPTKLPALPEPGRYRDFITYLGKQDLARAEVFWRDYLVGFTEPTPLPMNRLTPGSNEEYTTERVLQLPEETMTRIKALARSANVTVNTVIQAIWSVLLCRYAARADVVFGATVSGRPPDMRGVEMIFGPMLNTIPVRVQVTPEADIVTWLGTVQASAVQSLDFQDSSAVKINEWSEVSGGVNVYDSIIVFENFPFDGLAGIIKSNIELEEIEGYEQNNFPLTLTVVPLKTLTLKLRYHRAHFSDKRASRLLETLGDLVPRLLEAKRVHELLDATPEEVRLLASWNETDRGFDRGASLYRLFERTATRKPTGVALVAGGQEFTYGWLEVLAGKMASLLRQNGIGCESLVGVCLDRSATLMVTLLGVLRAGAAYVPLDPTHPAERLDFIAADAGLDLILTDSEGVALDLRVPNLSLTLALIEETPGGLAPVSVDTANLAYVIYTSGSTGRPKGVEVNQGTVVNFLTSMAVEPGLQERDRLLALTTISFDIAGLELYLPLMVGGVVVLASRETAQDGYQLARTLEDERITVAQATPATWQLLFASEWEGLLSLRVFCGGEALPDDLARRLQASCHSVWNLYGPTETTIWSTATRVEDQVHIGKPIANTSIHLLAPHLAPVPLGAGGELFIGGLGLARGYHDRPALTAQRFLPDPFSPQSGARFYRTGDLARFDEDGAIHYLSRVDFQIKIRGFRIEQGEIERVLVEHSHISAAVVTLGDLGTGSSVLVAYVVGDDKTGPEAVELRTFLGRRLPDYMIPTIFVRLDHLPLTQNGKIDRKALPAISRVRGVAAAPPRDENERLMASIWSEVLGCADLGIHDNFFEVGGHSLLAMRLIGAIRDKFGVRLSLHKLLKVPTVEGTAALAASLTGSTAVVEDPQEQVTADNDNRYEAFPLTDVQYAYLVGRGDAFELSSSGTQGYMELDVVGLDPVRLEEAWNALIQRHDMLRAVFYTDHQRVQAEVPYYRFQAEDFRDRPEADVTCRIDEIRAEMVDSVFDPEVWPLFNIRISRLPDRYKIHFSADMLVADATSFQILYREWTTLYNNPREELPAIDITFRDVVLGMDKVLKTERYQESLRYWKKRLPDLPPAPDLPLARNPGDVKETTFIRSEFSLEKGRWQQLKQRARKLRVTPSALVLTTFAEVLGNWSSSPRLSVNLTVFHRPPIHQSIDEVVGDFTTTTYAAVDANSGETFRERAVGVQEQLWESMAHAHVSGVEVLRMLSSLRTNHASALMPVVFTALLGQTAEDRDTTITPLGAEIVYSRNATSQVWLDHQAYEQGGKLYCRWDTVDELFHRDMLKAMFRAYQQHLNSLVDGNWDRETPALIPAEQLAFLAEINGTDFAVEEGLLHEPFLIQAQEHPQRIAVITTTRTLSYGELYRIALDLGHSLRQKGVVCGATVAVIMEKGWEQVAALLGIEIAGGAYVPIAPELPEERRHLLLKDCGAVGVLTQSKLSKDLSWPASLERFSVDTVQPRNLPSLEALQDHRDLAYVIFTSGSTGTPKGVAIDHRGACNTILDINRRFSVGPKDRVLGISRLGFDLSVYDVFGPLAVGAALVLPNHFTVPDPRHWATMMRKHKVTIWNSAPPLMQILTTTCQGDGDPDSNLRLIMLSGDWIPLNLPAEMRGLFPEAQFISMGGATEASIWSIIYPFDQVEPGWKSVPYGRPMANQTFHVLNERMEPCPIWVTGQLYIGGIGLAIGYMGDEEKTRASFFYHGPSGERLYRTGDLGRYLPDGNIEFLGRDDSQVKIQGHRIELGEIESTLLQHEQVGQALVTAVGKDKKNRRLVAYFVPIQDERSGDPELVGDLEGVITDPLQRLAFKFERPGVRKDLDVSGSLHLDQGSEDRAAFISRQSFREYLGPPVSCYNLGALLKHLGFITEPNAPFPKYRYPSAGNLYAVQVYLYLKEGRVDGAEKGFYYYHPVEHSLCYLSGEDLDAGPFGKINEPVFQNAAFALFMAADLDALEPIYGKGAQDFCILEAGYMGQLLMEQAPQHMLGLCPIGRFGIDEVRASMCLSDRHILLHTIVGGSVTAKQQAMLALPEHQKAARTTTEEAIREFLESKLPSYMVPGVLMPLEQMPLTSTGKIDRKRLPQPDINLDPRAFAAASTHLEKTVAGVWQEVLGLSTISVNDSFFELGGHSVTATRVVAQINEELRIELSLRELFLEPTVRDLTAHIHKNHVSGQGQMAQTSALPKLVVNPANQYEPYELTDVQQAYWIGRRDDYQMGGVATHSYSEMDCSGLDLARFQSAWQALVARHPMLRTVINPDGRQQLVDVPDYQIAFEDFLGMDPVKAEVRQQEIRDRMSHQVFDTSKWPIFEIRAARVEEASIRLFISLDLIAADSWSFRIMSTELWHLYTKLDVDLPVLELTFRDYLIAEQKLRQTNLYQRSLAYWRSRLAELPPAPSLPMAKKPQDLHVSHFIRRQQTLEAKDWQSIKKTGLSRGLTPSMILLTAFSEVLGYWSESCDFTINLTLFNRLPIHPQVNDIVGDFTSLTLLSVFGSNSNEFGTKVHRNQQQLLADLEHRYVSGVEVLRMLAQADPNHIMKLMPVVFTSMLTQDFDAGEAEEVRFGDVSYSVSQTAQVWLDYQVMEAGGELFFSWDSVDALFPAGMLDEMFAAYTNRLKQLARDEQVWDRDCPPLLSASSLAARQLANETAAPVVEGLIHSAFVENALRKPDEIAVIAPDKTLSYDQVLRLALPLARQLREAGVLPDQLVGLVFDKGWQQVVGAMAILLAGGAYLPIDATMPEERLHQLLALGACGLAVTDAHLRDRLNWPETVSVYIVSEQTTDEQLELLETVQKPDDLAYVIFTSGSTGQPKGVAIEHRSALNTLLDVNARFQVAPGDRLLGVSSMSFDLSVYDVFGILGAGATLVLPEPAKVPDPSHWARLMDEHGVTIWNSVPALVQILVDYLRDQTCFSIPLRLVLKSGDWIPVGLPDQIRELWGDARTISMGGATEGSIWSIIYEIGQVDPAWASIPYGKPMVNQTYHILNTAGQPCPVWVPGHLYIGGIGVAREYWGDADKTAASFVDHAASGERLYATGDLGRYLPDGNIEFLGRDDFQVKIQGYRIELGEIESVLRDHPAVSSCLVDTVGGRHDRRLVAYIVAAVQDPDYAEVKNFLAERLPAYMVPSQHVFIETFPLTANGKVNRKALPAPGGGHKVTGQAGLDGVPAAMIEETAALIGQLLEIDPPDSREDLYNIGVNSVDIIRIMNLVEKHFGVRPQLIAFLESPSVFGLASLVNELVAVGQGQTTLPVVARPEVAVLTDPAEREAFKTGQPAKRSFDDVRNFELGEVSEEQLLQRRSWRSFLGKPILRESFQNLLAGLASIEINGLRKHAYPSAGSTYVVQTYVHVKANRIEDYPGGIYFFDPVGNRLQLFNPQPALSKTSFEPFINAPIFERAAFCIILVAKMGAIEPLYGEQATGHVYIEAGAMIQLLMTRAIETNLGMCPIGEIADQTLREDCFLDEDHLFLNVLMGGGVDPSLPWTSYKDPASLAVEAVEPQLVRTDLSKPIPLSPPQERLWVLQQLDPENSAYNETSTLHLRGSMDVAAWWDGVTRLIERHPMLRTRFTTMDSRPCQIINDAASSELTLVDLRHLPEERRTENAQQLVLALSLAPFDLTVSGLFRPLMIRLSDDVHYFVLVLHHIVADFWSSSILHSEFMTLYNAHLSDTPTELPELPVQYGDYARWQRKRLIPERLEELLAFWRETLRDVPVLELPVDRVRPRVQSFAGERVFFSFPTSLVHAVQAFSVSHSISVFNTILAAYQTLLFRYTEQTDISVGVPIANRDRSELETIIGFFVNSLVMRTDLSGRPSFTEVTKRVRDVSMRAYAHQDAPFERVVDACAPDRSVSFTPLFQAVLDFLAIEEGSVEPMGLSIEPLEFHNGTCKFDVVLSVAYARDRSMSGFIEYNSEIFERERIERMGGHLQALLADALDHSEREIDRLQILPEVELAELAAFNDTRSPYTTDQCLHQLFETAVVARPDAPAARCGEERLSYAELNQRANRLAHLLINRGVKSGSYVGICLYRSLDMLVGVLGINKAGGIYVPMDADFPAERIHGILVDVSADICVTHSGLSQLFEGSASAPVFLDTGDFSAFSSVNPDLEISPDDFSYVIFTSGSTGRPKGVILQHRPVVNLIEWVNQTYAVGRDDRLLFITSLCFDLSVYDIFGMLAAGGQVEVAVEAQVKNPEALVQLIETCGITFWDSAPAALDQLVSYLPGKGQGSNALRLVFLSGDWIPLTLPPALQRCYPNLKVIGLGGATEAAIWSNFFPVGEILPHWKSVPYGRPIQNSRYYVLNAALQRCPKGVPGDLYIGDKCLSFGYFGQPALTAERYLPDPYNSEPGSVLYRTGDRNRHMPDVVLEFLGRLDGQVKVRGYRIELGEIEARLAGHPLITQSAVIAREISFANKRLAAFVVTEQELSTRDLRTYLGETLPDYMIPATFTFLEALPVTSNGKLDRKVLHAHTPAQAKAQDGFAAPATQIEIMLADIWEPLLGLERIGIHDHFFEVGGDSILAIQVVNKVRAEGYEASPRMLFEFPTIARLSQVLPTLAALEERVEEAIGQLPLTPVQHWFFETVTTDPHCFNQSATLEVHGRLDALAMNAALKALGHHHGALRSRFVFDQTWRQEIPVPEDWTPMTLEVVELEEIDPAERATMRKHATDHTHGSLDLASGQLVRVVYFDFGSDEPGRLLIVAHHLVVDGISWRILIEDLGNAYQLCASGESPLLPPPTTSYGAWSRRLGEYAASGKLDREKMFWQTIATRPMEPLPKLGQRDNSVATTQVGVIELSESGTETLVRETLHTCRAEINDVLLAALALTLRQWLGRETFLVNLEGHGREDLFANTNLSNTVGWFTSMYPVFLDLAGTTDHFAAVGLVKDQLHAIPSKGIGYGILRYLCAGEEGDLLAAAPKAEIGFNYFGRFDAPPGGHGLFRLANEENALRQSPRQERLYALDFNCVITQGCFQLSCSYSSQQYDSALIEELLGNFKVTLEDLNARTKAGQIMPLTPSDFPEAALTRGELAVLVDRLKPITSNSAAELEMIYPLSPLQQGMFYHVSQAPGTGLYVLQLCLELRGEFDSSAFRKAWQMVIADHDVFRALFVGLDTGKPLQVVLSEINSPFAEQDWREDVDDLEARFEAFLLADRNTDFVFDKAPLMRLHLIRVADDCHRFVWTLHHVLSDGWSNPVVLMNLFKYYEACREGKQLSIQKSRPYRDFIRWIGQQDPDLGKAFWQKYLQGFKGPNKLIRDVHEGEAERAELRKEVTFSLDPSKTEEVKRLVRQHKVTLSVAIQGLWGLTLGFVLGDQDVVFGTTISGRPSELPGVEGIVGPFIATLPVRVRLNPKQFLNEWVTELQVAQIERGPHEHTPLVDIQKSCKLPAGQSLFQCLLQYQNYPKTKTDDAGDDPLSVSFLSVKEKDSYPFTLMVMPGDILEVMLKYDPARLEPLEAERLAQSFSAAIKAFLVCDEKASLQTIQDQLAAADRHVKEQEQHAFQKAQSASFLKKKRTRGNRRKP